MILRTSIGISAATKTFHSWLGQFVAITLKYGPFSTLELHRQFMGPFHDALLILGNVILPLNNFNTQLSIVACQWLWPK